MSLSCAHTEKDQDFRPPSQLAAEAATTDWLRDLLDRRFAQNTLEQLAQRAVPDFQLSTRERDLVFSRAHQISHSSSAWAVVGLEDKDSSSSFGMWETSNGYIEAPPYAHSYRALLILDERGTPRWSLDEPGLRVNVIDADGDDLREEALIRSEDGTQGPHLWALYDLRETPPAPMLALKFDIADGSNPTQQAVAAGEHVLPGGGAWTMEDCKDGTRAIVVHAGAPDARRELARYHWQASQRKFVLEGASPEVASPELERSPWTRTGFRGTHFAYRGRRDPARMVTGIGWPVSDQGQNFPQQLR